MTALALAALTGAATISAQAQITGAQQSAIKASCRSDFMSKCSGVTPGGKDALVCLQKNVASLSTACKTAVTATLPPPAPVAAAKPVETAPQPAAVSAAPAPAPMAPPKAAVMKPAKPIKRTVKIAVAAPAAPTAAHQSAMRSACRSDFMAKCSGVQPGGRDALACLQRHVATLSPKCKHVVSATMGAPATAMAPPPATPPSVAPAPAARESGPVPGGLIISKACARYVLMHCPGMGLNMGRKVACLVDYVNSGQFVGPRCRAALKITGHLR